ncbi:MAG: hypothetical protein HN736_04735 [Anaerolineae bacterium]|jgi:hypothetical protein|nr:hypothetical protein [Anaerolineae bacterium]MBT3712813.1 hypothetical protein [Anaerolineae bacterium]MBT4309043.1 hypothetical protein [Anaerolineae bacterium]MBT4840878.1 hypothetical protein [Anaerolineae bacterium]MBT6063124.1 hypothetical protein [Anaerolineae bacterium]
MPELLSVLNLIVVMIIGIWGVLQIRVTKQLDEKIHRLNIELDQSIQLLYRARDTVINVHRSHIHILTLGSDGCADNLEVLASKFSEHSAFDA